MTSQEVELPDQVAETVAVPGEPSVTVKVTDVWPAGTVTVAGTKAIRELLLESVTVVAVELEEPIERVAFIGVF